jgi:hypothetical protein
VYDRGDGYVVKVALNDEGLIANMREANWDCDYIPLAPCHLEWSDPRREAVLIMEKIARFPARGEKLPEWTMSVDCAQVGYLADDRLVAYDL